MSIRIGVVTLGCADLERAQAFYETLLDATPVRDRSGVAYFRLDGSWLALYPREDLARYCGVPAAGSGFEGITLSVNLASPAAVDAVLARAEAAGATRVRAAGPADWGGHVAWLADPDGHLWELVFNPKAERLAGRPGVRREDRR